MNVQGNQPPSRRPLDHAAAWIAAGLGLALTVWLFYPGFLSWDSAYQWHQVRTGTWDNVHPVIMTLIWTLTDRVWAGPGGLFLLQVGLYWLGLAALATALFERAGARAGMVLALGLFPAVFAQVPHLWKDVGMLIALIWAVALLAHERLRPSRRLRLAALAALTIACAFRHNALPVAIPLIWYITGRGIPTSRGWRCALSAGLLLVVAVLASLPNRLPGVAQYQVWPVTATWDLAAVSIAQREILLPGEITEPDLTLDDLDGHFMPHAAVPIYNSSKIHISVGPTAFSGDQMAATNAAWLRLWRDHPFDYLAHRGRLAALLFGLRPTALPDDLIVHYGITQFADNPPVAAADNAGLRVWRQWVAGWADSPVFAFWLYVLMLLAVAWSAHGRRVHPLLAPVLWSALLLTLPLLVVAPGADFRFLIWPVFCSGLALALRLTTVNTHLPGTPTQP